MLQRNNSTETGMSAVLNKITEFVFVWPYVIYSACVTHCVCLSIHVSFVYKYTYTHTHSNHGNLNETHYIANKTFYLFYTHAQPIANHRITPFIPLPTHILLIVHQSLEDRIFFLSFVCLFIGICLCACLPFHHFVHLSKLIYRCAFFMAYRHLLLCSAPKSKTD